MNIKYDRDIEDLGGAIPIEIEDIDTDEVIDYEAVPEHINDCETRRIQVPSNSPYGPEARCICGAVWDGNSNMSEIRTIFRPSLGRLQIIWCPLC